MAELGRDENWVVQGPLFGVTQVSLRHAGIFDDLAEVRQVVDVRRLLQHVTGVAVKLLDILEYVGELVGRSGDKVHESWDGSPIAPDLLDSGATLFCHLVQADLADMTELVGGSQIAEKNDGCHSLF